MKLLIVTNFAYPFHTGGSEKIVQQVAETMVREYGWHVDIFCNFGNCRKIYNGVHIVPFPNNAENLFIDNIIDGKYDTIFVYGDLSTRLQCILEHINIIKTPIVLAAVGFNKIRSNDTNAEYLRKLILTNVNKLKIIVHSDDYLDSMFCKQHKIPYTVIHNSIDLEEFTSPTENIRNIYNLGQKKIVLCVSNFFPGKGQEYIIDLVQRSKNKRNDYVLIFVSSTLAYRPGNIKRQALQNLCTQNNLPIVFLNDIPRHHIISLYKECLFTICASEQEVGPIIILESMAAKKPWISTNVGHVHQLCGGFCFPAFNSDKSKPILFDDELRTNFMNSMEYLLDHAENSNMGKVGYEQILNEYNWEHVKLQYKNILDNNEVIHAK